MTDSKQSSRVLELALSMPWAITEDYLRTILNIAAREELFPEAISFQEDRKPDEDRTTRIRNRTAVIPVTGPIFRRANLFMRFSGGTSTELLALEIGEALESPSVRAIVLDIDSPGGEANGISEVAEMIYRARSVKPVVAYVGDLGASGAYWLASAASAVITSPTGLLGSIGVRTTWIDDKERMKQMGLREIEIVSSQSPNKAPDPATSEGKAEIQRVIDDMAEVFITDVARNRGVDRETVIGEFGGGGIMVGQRAVEAGLADRVATFEDVMAAVEADADWISDPGAAVDIEIDVETPPLDAETAAEQAAGRVTTELSERTRSMPEEKTQPEITATYIQENHPDVAEHFVAEGRSAERERIKAIEDLSTPGCEDLVAELKYDPEMTAGEAALRIVAAQKEKRQRQLGRLRGDEEKLEAPDASVDGGGSDEQKEIARTVALYNQVNGGRTQLQQ